jgi:hypothetical protein
MNKELFGVIGDRAVFDEHTATSSYDWVHEGERATVAVRDPALGLPARTAAYTDERGACLLWGEVLPPEGATSPAAERTLDRFEEVGTDAFAELNGSFLAFVELDGEAILATDPARTWQCFYADTPHGRVFGTDPQHVLDTVGEPTVDSRGVLEFVHLSVVVDDRTVFEELSRVPFDGYMTGTSVGTLDRFVYDHEGSEDVDWVGELADRMRRAIRRRAVFPGKKGLLLSAGYDSRVVAAEHPSLDVCYTLGQRDHPEVAVAGDIAAQYDIPHETLLLGDDYLNTDRDTIEYGMGINESIHIHQAGCLDDVDVDTVYHSLYFDTLFRGHFLPRDSVEVLDYTFPLTGLEPDPDVTNVLTSKFGYHPACDHIFPECFRNFDTSRKFTESVFEEQLDKWSDRYDNVYDSLALLGIQNQPTLSFHYHLGDNFIESFIAADSELIDWHLRAPPEVRSTKTFLAALRRLDDDILRHRPPNRPHDSFRKNQIEKFLRDRLPFVDAFERPWPELDERYEEQSLDTALFPGYPSIHELPVRMKLRVNDISTWMNEGFDHRTVTANDVLCPSGSLPVES